MNVAGPNSTKDVMFSRHCRMQMKAVEFVCGELSDLVLICFVTRLDICVLLY